MEIESEELRNLDIDRILKSSDDEIQLPLSGWNDEQKGILEKLMQSSWEQGHLAAQNAMKQSLVSLSELLLEDDMIAVG